MTATMPTTVKVGTLTYTILTDADEIRRMSEAADIEKDAEWAAFSDHDALVIGINPGHHPDQNRVSIVHELLHCVLRVSGSWPDAYARTVSRARGNHGGFSVEESVVSATAAPVLGVLRENPDLMAWLLEVG